MTIQMTLPTMVFDLTEEEYAELVGTLQEIIINDRCAVCSLSSPICS